ncbi:DUF3060 domain-containing protein [Mycolicibacterium thermoresistibile]|uniref:DUF3060 domain-containing protein n=1 Tax=Mycolicibacterium thermoresistibile TaxID=1797 RepID=UPI00338FA950
MTASGVHNEITVESAGLIVAAGIGIRVTYRSGEPNSNCPGSATSCRRGEGRTQTIDPGSAQRLSRRSTHRARWCYRS